MFYSTFLNKNFNDLHRQLKESIAIIERLLLCLKQHDKTKKWRSWVESDHPSPANYPCLIRAAGRHDQVKTSRPSQVERERKCYNYDDV